MNAGMALGLIGLCGFLPGQELQLENLRTPMGVYGSSLPANHEWVPGDLVLMSFDLTGLKTRPPGRVFYSVGVKLQDPQGKFLIDQAGGQNEAYLPLGGGQIPAYAACDLPANMAPGTYTMTLIAEDASTKKQATAIRKIQIGPRKFGIVRVNNTFATNDAAPNIAYPGQQFVLRFGLANCTIDPKTLRGKQELRIRILDDKGKSLMEKPIVTEITEVLDEVSRLSPCTYPYQPNRPGRFQIEIEAVDQLSPEKSSAKLLYPLVIVEPK